MIQPLCSHHDIRERQLKLTVFPKNIFSIDRCLLTHRHALNRNRESIPRLNRCKNGETKLRTTNEIVDMHSNIQTR